MGWLSPSTQQAAAPESKQSSDALLHFFGGSQPDPQYPAPTFMDHYSQGFAKNELVYASIVEKATSAPEAPLRVFPPDGLGDPLENHPLRRLVANPNPMLTEFELFELTVLHLDLAGNAFWLVVLDNGGRPIELWPLRPDLVRQLVARRQKAIDTVVGYSYVVDGAEIPLGRNVVHFKYPNPADWLVGQAPLRPAMHAVTLDNRSTDFVTNLLQNNAVPGLVIKTQQEVDQNITDRLKAQWKATFTGKGIGDPAVLQKGMEVERLGIDPTQMEFPDLRTIAESRITMAFGVPPILVGAKVGLDRSTFSNFGEARKTLWEETLMPLQRRLRDRVVKDLLPLLRPERGRRVTVKFDHSQVLALQESEQARWERATQALRAGAIRVSDFLRIVGLPRIEGTDVFLRPAGVIPTEGDGTPTAQAQAERRGIAIEDEIAAIVKAAGGDAAALPAAQAQGEDE